MQPLSVYMFFSFVFTQHIQCNGADYVKDCPMQEEVQTCPFQMMFCIVGY